MWVYTEGTGSGIVLLETGARITLRPQGNHVQIIARYMTASSEATDTIVLANAANDVEARGILQDLGHALHAVLLGPAGLQVVEPGRAPAAG